MTNTIDNGALPELDEAGVERMQRTVMGGVAQRVARRRTRRTLLLGGAGVLAAAVIVGSVIGNQPRGLITADSGWSGAAPEYGWTDPAPGTGWSGGDAPPIEVDMTSEGGGIRYSGSSASGSVGAVPGRPGELTPAPPGDTARSVISKASVRVRVNDVPDAAQATIAHTTELGGFVEARNQRGDSGSSGATLTLRVPAAQLESLIERLGELGTVLEISTSDDDVTLTVRDLDARIGALRTSIERLQELLEQSASVKDLLEAETQLSYRQQELESLLSQQTYLSEQVSMATVQVQLQPSDAPVELEPEGFWGGLLIGWNALVVALGGIITGLGVLLPWLGVIGVAVLVIWLVVALRRRGRRARHTSLQAAQTLPDTTE